jgi:hypothetical protein
MVNGSDWGYQWSICNPFTKRNKVVQLVNILILLIKRMRGLQQHSEKFANSNFYAIQEKALLDGHGVDGGMD